MSATTASTLTPARVHLFWIDWMRFLAAAFVLLDHACLANWSGKAVPVNPAWETFLRVLVSPTHLGREAVTVFFVLSGALVGNLTLEKIRAGTFDAGAYAADRIARIYVPLVAAIVLDIGLLWFSGCPVIPTQHVGCLFALQGVITPTPFDNPVLWTLAYETWFYVLAGCAGMAAARRDWRLSTWLIAWAGGVLALVVLCRRLEWINFAYWLAGAFGFRWRDRISQAARPWVSSTGVCLLIAGTGGFWVGLLGLFPALGHTEPSGDSTRVLVGVGTVLFLVGGCRLAPATRVGKWIERLGTPLAAFSYTLYLTHFPVLNMLTRSCEQYPKMVTWYTLARLLGWLAVCIGVALVMYQLFEAQTPQVRRWLRERFRRKDAAPIPWNQPAGIVEA